MEFVLDGVGVCYGDGAVRRCCSLQGVMGGGWVGGWCRHRVGCRMLSRSYTRFRSLVRRSSFVARSAYTPHDIPSSFVARARTSPRGLGATCVPVVCFSSPFRFLYSFVRARGCCCFHPTLVLFIRGIVARLLLHSVLSLVGFV